MAVRGQSEFLNLPFKEKLEFLYGLPARQKRDLILSAPEAERLVQSFAPETLFYTLKEIGSADAGDLLSLALPEQVKSLFDLDCWDKDRPNVRRMREWIEALAEGGRRRMADGLMELDLELMSIVLRSYIKVHRLEDPASSPDAPSNRFVQFDENYLIEFIRHDSISQHISDFLEEAFERDYKYFSALMEEIYWGAEPELEEEAYRFRRARLNDRGFPDFFEAQSVFAYLRPADFERIRAGYEKPIRGDSAEDGEIVSSDTALMHANGANQSLFNTALTAGFAADGKRQVRSEMAMVSNEVLIARSVDFGDLDAVRITIEMTHNYLNLALEHLAGGELPAAIGHLRDTHLKLLFRLGVSLTIDLRSRAEALVADLGLSPKAAPEIPYLDSPHREALGGFRQRQPRYYAALDGGGSVEMRDFRNMRDLHAAYAVLDQIAATAALFRAVLGIDIASAAFRAETAAREVRLSQILTTALVRNALDGRLDPAPIEESRVVAARSAIMTAGTKPSRLTESFRTKATATISERFDGTPRIGLEFVDSCLNALEQEFADLGRERTIDPRFIRTLLVRRG
ncbi:MAG TPA: DUF6178 family protein [Candidatus Binataceae bacterium]|nr:DUF6178 family protein [Candidatus Binataceae bacterium]